MEKQIARYLLMAVEMSLMVVLALGVTPSASLAEVTLVDGLYHRHVALMKDDDWKDFHLQLVYFSKRSEKGTFGAGWGLLSDRRFVVAPDGVARLISYCEREESLYAPPVFDGKASNMLIQRLVDLASLQTESEREEYRLQLASDPGLRFDAWFANRVELGGLKQHEPVSGGSGVGSCTPRILRTQHNGYRLTSGSDWFDFNPTGDLVSEGTVSVILTFHRDAHGRIVAIDGPSGRKVSMVYNTNGLVRELNLSDGRKATFAYGDSGNLLAFTTFSGERYSCTYHEDGLLEKLSLNDVTNEQIDFADNGQVRKVIDSTGATQWYSYCGGPREEKGRFQGAVITRKDGEEMFTMVQQHWFTVGGDGIERLKRVFRELDGPETLSFDDSGQVIEQRLAEEVITYAYDAKHRLVGRKSSYGATVELSYDDEHWKISRVRSSTAEDTVQVGFSYDARSNLKRIETSTGEAFELTYNDRAQIATISDGKSLLTFQYNSAGKAAVIAVQGMGKIITTYTESGEVVSVSTELEKGVDISPTKISVTVSRLLETIFGLTRLASVEIPRR